jgi:outer membrane protein TolC
MDESNFKSKMIINQKVNTMIKHCLIFIFGCVLIVYSTTTKAQTNSLSISECYTLAKANYPLAKQQELITKSSEYSLQNASKGYLPQISINGQATYQSAVTQIPIQIPGMDIPSLSKDQYKVYGEINQTIFDGGVIKQQKDVLEKNAEVEKQKLEVELYKLKERINQLYFGILLIDEQLKQNDLLKKDIQSGLTKTNAAIDNGTALKSNAYALKAELLKANQRTIELKANRKSYIDMLGLFINQPLNEQSLLIKPGGAILSQDIKRPELLLYENQSKSLETQSKLLNAKNLPKLSAFLQGGYGRPALNMLSNKFEAYYIGGVRMNVPLSGLYTIKKDKALIDINRKNIEVQKETFLFNTNFALKQQNSEILKQQELLTADDEIISLRTNVKNTALAQLENGLITPSDYLREVNAEDNARLNKILHEIQLLMAEYNQQTTTGN